MKYYRIYQDFLGWAVSIEIPSKSIEEVKLGFRSREDAETYINKKMAEFYKGSGVLGNEI